MTPRHAAFDATDHAMMAHALRLAERGAYTARPNPMVGCIISRDGAIVGAGFHAHTGQPHAEVFALREAGDRARGATAYVTLEPCAHHGRTPPCADALIAAGIGRVVAAMRDPFPQVAGSGFDKLRAAGIEVASGLMEAQARELNRAFLSRIERGRPWLRIKLAASLDGRTAMPDGESKWITGEYARADVQRWRARSGAILTGAGTVLADDPALTARIDAGTPLAPPLRVVLDSRLRTLDRHRVREGDAPTLYLHAPETPVRAGVNAEFAAIPLRDGHLDLAAVLRLLAERGIGEAQVEAGPALSGAFLAGGLADEVLLYVAPILLGETGKPLFAGLGVASMEHRWRLAVVERRRIGADERLRLRGITR
ncbi:MAG: bifunctional diaminohydroxyphosphoribosylaminopyrimidine deaminase/5-amino-6-(5-phosphoribosylamino)uracil reductase RibD [Xanthomonadaceae bacterium]|jgi:diaminohydroxyphosphoribosylaminopyrimidine deaminase/5-amino-6-(5-phosphoribosylamino)uracil reductase|nr:bifunctional diaminohydroxyphosphoribosylaminopyrimidine deaminase/5-amino-6-(5-phosphoribosylamino)uracil reductase RibD [Xanthomonadaceae bacterium]